MGIYREPFVSNGAARGNALISNVVGGHFSLPRAFHVTSHRPLSVPRFSRLLVRTIFWLLETWLRRGAHSVKPAPDIHLGVSESSHGISKNQSLSIVGRPYIISATGVWQTALSQRRSTPARAMLCSGRRHRCKDLLTIRNRLAGGSGVCCTWRDGTNCWRVYFWLQQRFPSDRRIPPQTGFYCRSKSWVQTAQR